MYAPVKPTSSLLLYGLCLSIVVLAFDPLFWVTVVPLCTTDVISVRPVVHGRWPYLQSLSISSARITNFLVFNPLQSKQFRGFIDAHRPVCALYPTVSSWDTSLMIVYHPFSSVKGIASRDGAAIPRCPSCRKSY